ncbi:MAG: hypothetical protein HY698_10560 [Deltaproteobacteria bacterium]|nr:hypothetical protein [Deltaproteobacteria bacterium]
MVSRKGVAWLALVPLVLVSAPTMAQKKKKDAPVQVDKAQQAKDHYQRGITAYNLGEFDVAVREFKEAYALSSAPGLLFNIAQAYRLKKDYEQALYFYKTYLRLQPDAQNKDDVNARIVEMEKLLEEQKRVQNEKPQGTIPPGGTGVDEPTKPSVSPGTAARPTGSTPSQSDTGGTKRTSTSAISPTAAPSREGSKPGASEPKNLAMAGASSSSSPSAALPRIEARATPSAKSRERSLGGLIRADLDLSGGGVVAVGGSYVLGRSIELTGAGLLGKKFKGAWIGGSYYLGKGALRPMFSAGIPVFFVDGAQFGIHGALGARLDVGQRLSLFVELGGAAFPGAPEAHRKAVVLGTLGTQVYF